MWKYRRITYEDRCQIYALSKRGVSQESIAGVLGFPSLPLIVFDGARVWRTARSAGTSGRTVAVERTQINIPGGAAGQAIDPQEMVPGRERGADRRREQEGHAPGLALVPSGYQGFRVREHLRAGRTPRGDLQRPPWPSAQLPVSGG
jgi:hypothetical protein